MFCKHQRIKKIKKIIIDIDTVNEPLRPNQYILFLLIYCHFLEEVNPLVNPAIKKNK